VEAAQLVEGLTFDQLADAAPQTGSFNRRLLLRAILNDEVFAGRVRQQRDGRYTLAEGWDRELVAALRELREADLN
jgi:hypothetical protein